jgi:hypothetical protein
MIKALSILLGALRGGCGGRVLVGAPLHFLLLVIHYVEMEILVLHYLNRHKRGRLL